MTPPLPTPEQWLAYVGAGLAPEVRQAALSRESGCIEQARREGRSDAQIVSQLGDPQLAAQSLAREWPTLEDVQRLRTRLNWNPWQVALAFALVGALLLGLSWWEPGRPSAGLLVIPAFGLLFSGWLWWRRSSLSTWGWANLGVHLNVLFLPLYFAYGLFDLDEPMTPERTFGLLFYLTLVAVFYMVYASRQRKWEKLDQAGVTP